MALALVLTFAGLVALPGCNRPPPVTPGCTLAPTNGLERVTLGSQSYLVTVPSGLQGREAGGVPLVVALHGLGSEASVMAAYTPFDRSRFANYIAVYPEARDRQWRINQGSTDVAFLRQVVADVRGRYCASRTRVHFTGHSLGGFMAMRMACDAPEIVASVTEYAGASPSSGGSPCTPSRPITVALFHGSEDGIIGVGLGRRARDEWVFRLGCNPRPMGEPGLELTSFTYTGCRGGVEVRWREYLGQGHFWPNGDSANYADMRDRMLSVFNRFPLPR